MTKRALQVKTLKKNSGREQSKLSIVISCVPKK